MKHYDVTIDMTATVSVTVNAENEEQAKQLALQKTYSEESFHLMHYQSVGRREVVEVAEKTEGFSKDDEPADPADTTPA